jgi:hypothetical protein
VYACVVLSHWKCAELFIKTSRSVCVRLPGDSAVEMSRPLHQNQELCVYACLGLLSGDGQSSPSIPVGVRGCLPGSLGLKISRALHQSQYVDVCVTRGSRRELMYMHQT